MLEKEIKRIIEEQRLTFVATASLHRTPNVSPKVSFAILEPRPGQHETRCISACGSI